jgi:hypothetical protein
VRDVGVPSCSPYVTRYLTYSPLRTVFRSQASPCEISGGHGNTKTSIFPSTLAVPCQCHSTNAPYSLIHSFIHHWRCIIVAVVGIVKWNAKLCVRESVNGGTSVVTCCEVANVRDLSLAICLVLRNKVYYVNENDLVSVRLWFYIIADTCVKMKQVSTGARPGVMYKLYYHYVDIPTSQVDRLLQNLVWTVRGCSAFNISAFLLPIITTVCILFGRQQYSCRWMWSTEMLCGNWCVSKNIYHFLMTFKTGLQYNNPIVTLNLYVNSVW